MRYSKKAVPGTGKYEVGETTMNRKKLIPKYAIVPLLGMLLANMFTYFVTPVWTNRMTHYCMATKLDNALPFLPIFVVPYVAAFVQWVVGYLMIAGTDKEYCYPIFKGEILAKLMVCALFLLIPTTMTRAEITGTDIFSRLVALIYQMDEPVNLFPSIHCLESWFCFRGSMNRKYFTKKYTAAMGVMTLLVFLSTVFIKQHVVLDMLGAVAAAEAGLFLVKKCHFKLRIEKE